LDKLAKGEDFIILVHHVPHVLLLRLDLQSQLDVLSQSHTDNVGVSPGTYELDHEVQTGGRSGEEEKLDLTMGYFAVIYDGSNVTEVLVEHLFQIVSLHSQMWELPIDLSVRH
jgi:hypothetical protein